MIENVARHYRPIADLIGQFMVGAYNFPSLTDEQLDLFANRLYRIGIRWGVGGQLQTIPTEFDFAKEVETTRNALRRLKAVYQATGRPEAGGVKGSAVAHVKAHMRLHLKPFQDPVSGSTVTPDMFLAAAEYFFYKLPNPVSAPKVEGQIAVDIDKKNKIKTEILGRSLPDLFFELYSTETGPPRFGGTIDRNKVDGPGYSFVLACADKLGHDKIPEYDVRNAREAIRKQIKTKT